MGLMKYQLGISGEIVSFFLEFDHAWDAGKARERERERRENPFSPPPPSQPPVFLVFQDQY